MVDTVYIEKAALEHQRSQTILARYPKAKQIIIENYSQVFNSHTQNFRLQKQNPALILAQKQNKRVLPAPEQYETGGGAHYYFSHMLNCLYDCRYCFLQGMYRSANYLLFVNYEDFADDLNTVAQQHSKDDKPAWFFSGYDCDSLAFEPVSHFADYFVPLFETLPNAILELRTKSTQIRSLLQKPAQQNVVIAYSLNPDNVAQTIELGAPSLTKRLQAMQQLQNQGWRVGIRFDPVIWHENWQESYRQLLAQCFSYLDADRLENITIGGFRQPKGFFKIMRRLYPEHWLFSAGVEENDGMVAYQHNIEQTMLNGVADLCSEYVNRDKVFLYMSDDNG